MKIYIACPVCHNVYECSTSMTASKTYAAHIQCCDKVICATVAIDISEMKPNNQIISIDAKILIDPELQP